MKLVTEGTWKTDGTADSKDGYSVWRLGPGQDLRPLPHEDLESVAKFLIVDMSWSPTCPGHSRIEPDEIHN